MSAKFNLPTFCSECGCIHKITSESLSYPPASVAVDGKETS